MIIRPWQPGDEDAIISMFQTVFGVPMTPEFWRWRYCDHPAGEPMIMLAWDGDRLAAHYAASHAPLLVDGEARPAGLSMTTMTHPDYRGQGLFEQTASALYEEMAARGLYAVWGFPNKNSNIPFRRKLEWDGVADIPTLSRMIGDEERFDLGDVAEVERISKIFDTVHIDGKGISADRRHEILSWRIDQNPVNSYIRLVLCETRGDALSGYAILKSFKDGEFDLVLLQANEQDRYQALISASLAYVKERGGRRINTWSMLQDPARLWLERAGFLPNLPLTNFAGRSFVGDAKKFGDPRLWRVAMLDSDLF